MAAEEECEVSVLWLGRAEGSVADLLAWLQDLRRRPQATHEEGWTGAPTPTGEDVPGLRD